MEKLALEKLALEKLALAIFVKTPGLSPVKTRLASTLGDRCAERYFALSAKTMEELAVRLQTQTASIFPHWAVAEQQALTNSRWQSLPRVWQGSGSLNDRLAKIYRTLRKEFDAVVLIGADCPLLDMSDITATLAHLAINPDPSFVVGPAHDGGFYLFGSTAELDPAFWSGIRCSTPHACNDLVESASAIGEVVLLQEKLDVDTESDLRALFDQVRRTKQPAVTSESTPKLHEVLEAAATSPAQTELADWLQELLGDKQ